MHTTENLNRPRAARYAAAAAADDATGAKYLQMLELARTLGLEYEVERIETLIGDFEESADENREQALRHGYDPDLGY